MHPGTAVIRISNLRLRTLVGFNAEERVKKQDVLINIEIQYRMKSNVVLDSVQDALDYKNIAKRVIAQVEEGSFLLLEKLAADVLASCSLHPSVQYAHVTVDKPHALRYADSVSISLAYHANRSGNLRALEKAS